jgi:hypothetical protein
MKRINTHSDTWLAIVSELKNERADLVEALVQTESERVRCKIQVIDELLNLPETMAASPKFQD